ncbi:hypothetical protein, partial [Desulfobacula sp.]|uniref:hypothetical protein n=1 Tax=Desulfobacula sp. TaxID=2593537 RepID=UPI0039B9752E
MMIFFIKTITIILISLFSFLINLSAAQFESEFLAYFKTRIEISDSEKNSQFYSYYNYEVHEIEDNKIHFYFGGWAPMATLKSPTCGRVKIPQRQNNKSYS